MGECTRWHDGRLHLSDWGANEILAVDAAGNAEVLDRRPGYPFSFDFLADGRMLIVSGPEGLLLRREHDGSVATVADLRPLSGFSWNEIVIDAHDNAYVNTINFEFGAGMEGNAPPPDDAGIVALVRPDGVVEQVADGLEFPNGMVITPDGRTLVVGESFRTRLTAYDIAADGTLSNRRLWAQLDGGPDGICMDADGAIWTPAASTAVRVAEGGEVLQTIQLPEGLMGFANMLGGPDGRTLYIAAAEWKGPEHIFDEPHTGVVLRAEGAPASHAGRP